MKISARIYEVLTNETDRLIDRLNEAVALDFADARDNGRRKPSPDVVAATEAAHDEYVRLAGMLRSAGARLFGRGEPLAPGASLTKVYGAAMPLVRRITNVLRKAEPEIGE
jgi:hypothetical protein